MPVAYLRSELDYQSAYMRCFTERNVDLSVLFYQNKKPVGIWPLSLQKKDGLWFFMTNQGPVLPPRFIHEVSDKWQKRFISDALSALRSFFQQAADKICSSWQSNILLETNELGGGTAWRRNLLEAGGVAVPQHELYLDLSLDLSQIHGLIRKSFRSLINEGERQWKVEIHEQVSHELFDAFRLFHQQVAGRVTRSQETWDLQEQTVNAHEGVLLTSRDDHGDLIGASLFSISRDEAVYGVGVYDRSLFDKPISHVLQWEAIKYFKTKGIKWYKVGRRFYPVDRPKPTEKELSISYFKEGFASHLLTEMIIANER